MQRHVGRVQQLLELGSGFGSKALVLFGGVDSDETNLEIALAARCPHAVSIGDAVDVDRETGTVGTKLGRPRLDRRIEIVALAIFTTAGVADVARSVAVGIVRRVRIIVNIRWKDRITRARTRRNQ